MGRSHPIRIVLLTVFLAPAVLAAEPARAAKPAHENAAPAAGDASTGILAGDTPAGARIEKVLDESTEVEPQEAPLTDVIQSLKDRHKIEIQLDVTALEEAGTALDTPITRNLKNISLRSALRIVLAELKLTFLIRDEVLLITTKAQADTILQTRVYPVGDLIDHDNAEVIDLQPVAGLIETITGTVAMTTWVEVGGSGSIKYSSHTNSLVVAQTCEVHEGIRDLLIALRKAQAQERVPSKEQVADGGQGKLFVAIYPVSSMAIVHHSAAVPTPSDDNKDAEAADKGKPASKTPGSLAVSNRGLAEDLARVIPKVIEPTSWQAQGGRGSIESVGIGVAVRQTRQVHREVARFLRSVDARVPSGMGGMQVGSF